MKRCIASGLWVPDAKMLKLQVCYILLCTREWKKKRASADRDGRGRKIKGEGEGEREHNK